MDSNSPQTLFFAPDAIYDPFKIEREIKFWMKRVPTGKPCAGSVVSDTNEYSYENEEKGIEVFLGKVENCLFHVYPLYQFCPCHSGQAKRDPESIYNIWISGSSPKMTC